MTLLRQLMIPTSLVFLALLVGIQAINLTSVKEHLQGQLESHSQDAATSLGLSLGILLSRGDAAIAETVINAAFDRGHWKRIEFIDAEGRELVKRELPEDGAEPYPGWLPEVLPLHGVTTESLVTSGWRQMGRVRVTSHPRLAYAQLWGTAQATLVWMILIYALATLLLMWVVRGILRPLTAVERAAQAISRRDFVQVAEQPVTRELARVIEAMNSLSVKVKEALEAETARAERLQRAAYVDPVSGLLNRVGLDETFNSRFQMESGVFSGMVTCAQIADMAAVNAALGQTKADEFVRSLAEQLLDAAGKDGLVARWMGARFVLVLPGGREAGVQALERASALTRSLLVEWRLGPEAGLWIGGAFGDVARPVFSELLGAAEKALQQAIDSHSESPVVSNLVAAEETRSVDRAEVERILRPELVRLVAQEAIGFPGGERMHLELMVRLVDEAGRIISPAEFIPLVTRFRLAQQLDRAVIESAVGGLRAVAPAGRGGSTQPQQPIVINLAAQSVADPAFGAWLETVLRKQVPAGAKLVFEVGEHGVLHDIEAAERFAALVTRCGGGFAIDHFGVHRDSLVLMRRLNPDYVKLSSVLTARMVSDPGTRFFVESVTMAARQLDVPVIVLGVENRQTVDAIATLGVSGYQGYVSGKPAPWPEARA